PDFGPAVVLPQPEPLTERFLFGDGLGSGPGVAIDGERADMQDPTDRRRPAGIEDVPGPNADVGAGLRPGAPAAPAGGAVIEYVGPGDGLPDGRGIAQIAGNGLGAEVPEEGHVAGRADEGPDALAAPDKLLGEMAAEQAGGPGHDVEHFET